MYMHLFKICIFIGHSTFSVWYDGMQQGLHSGLDRHTTLDLRCNLQTSPRTKIERLAQPTSWGVNRPKRRRIGPELSGLRHFNKISSSGSRADRAAVDVTAGTASNPVGWRHSEAGHWTAYPSSTFAATRLWRFRMKSQEKRSEARLRASK